MVRGDVVSYELSGIESISITATLIQVYRVSYELSGIERFANFKTLASSFSLFLLN
ncbi:hypothetical protein [Persephonella sp.]